MKILLDTNFILTCAKQKLDIDTSLNQITSEKIEYIIPQEVLGEISLLKNKSKTKATAELSFQIIQSLNPKIINLPTKNPNVDIKIANYIKDKNTVLATLDKKLKSRVKNKILTIRNKKSLKIISS